MKIKRASGGKSWADTMLMGAADSKEYVRIMLNRAQQVPKTVWEVPDKRIEAFFGLTGFILLYQGKVVLRKSYHYVECCRGKSVDDFLHELETLVTALRDSDAKPETES